MNNEFNNNPEQMPENNNNGTAQTPQENDIKNTNEAFSFDHVTPSPEPEEKTSETSVNSDEQSAETPDTEKEKTSSQEPVYTYETRRETPPPQPSINMQYKPRKTPKWLIGLIISIAAIYLAIMLFLIFSFMRFTKSANSSIQPNYSPYTQENDIPVEEHLQIDESPTSEGAKTSDDALTVKQISEKVRPSVVGVSCQSSSNFSSESVGSGIIMSEDGYIITNNHVIEGMTTIEVVLDDGKKHAARLIGADSRSDLAVIKIEATGLQKAEFGDSDKLEQGDPAIAIGNPAGLQLQNTVTYGIISAINRDIVVEDRSMTLIQTDASINPGNSGGPLVNEFGQVIGINTIKVGISYYEGLGFAIPMNTAKPIIDELISRGYIMGRPSIGINGTTLSERDAAFYNLPSGLYVEFVHPYSDAYKKGLRRGDVITKMNGTAFNSSAEIKKLRDNFKAGDTVTLTIYRNSQEIDIDVILMDEAALSNSNGLPN